MTQDSTPVLSAKDTARFWSKVDKTPGHGPEGLCWKWMAALNVRPEGYGRFAVRRDGHKVGLSAHRLSFVLAGGVIPEGLSVMHTCDYKPCVNPDHLLLGSQANNTADMVSKGRHGAYGRPLSFGPAAVRIRLAELAIKRGIGLTQLTEMCGTHPSQIMNLWYNRTINVNLSVLTELSEVLGVEPGELFGRAA